MESQIPPFIIPMWLTGFDQLMPEGRSFPYKYLPRPGAHLSVTFGNPIPAHLIRQALQDPPTSPSSPLGSALNDKELNASSSGLEVQRSWGDERAVQVSQNETMRITAAENLPLIRARVTALIHDAVQDLGRSVSGKTLCLPKQE